MIYLAFSCSAGPAFIKRGRNVVKYLWHYVSSQIRTALHIRVKNLFLSIHHYSGKLSKLQWYKNINWSSVKKHCSLWTMRVEVFEVLWKHCKSFSGALKQGTRNLETESRKRKQKQKRRRRCNLWKTVPSDWFEKKVILAIILGVIGAWDSAFNMFVRRTGSSWGGRVVVIYVYGIFWT